MKPFHIFLILTTAAAWGLNFVSTRIVLEVFTTEQLAFARSAISFLILLPWWQPWRKVSLKFLLAAMSVGVMSFYILYEAIRMTESLTTVAIGTQLMPPVAAVIALVFYQEHVSMKKWLGILVATGGAILLAGATGFGVSALALGITVISVVFYAAGSIGVSRTENIGIWRLLAWVAAVGIIPLGALAALAGPLYPDPASVGMIHWLALAYSIVFSALLGQAVLFSLYRIYPVSEVAPYTLFVPVFAGLFSVWIFGEKLSLGLVAGGAVVLLGVWIQQSRRQ